MVIREEGPEKWEQLLEKSKDYLTFLVEVISKKINIHSPSGKNELVQTIAQQIRQWEHPLMVHESLRKLAKLTQTPEDTIGIGQNPTPHVLIKKSASVTSMAVDPDRVIETDLLRWLFLMREKDSFFLDVARENLLEDHFFVPVAKKIYRRFLEKTEDGVLTDILTFSAGGDGEQQLFLSEILHKKVNLEKANEVFLQTVQQMLDRFWMHKREQIKLQIHRGQLPDDEVIELAKKFDQIRKNRPQVVVPEPLVVSEKTAEESGE